MEQYICINHLRIRLVVSGVADLDHRHKRQKKWSLFFESFGINPLYLYVQGDVFAVVLDKCGVTPYVYADVLSRSSETSEVRWHGLFCLSY